MGAADAAQRQLIGRAATVGLLMRHSANLGVAAVTLADPDTEARLPGRALLAVLACWALYRIATRSQRPFLTAIDYGLTLAVCTAIPLIVDDPRFYASNTAPQAIAGTAVISFAVALPNRLSLLMTAGLAIVYACGSAAVVGWAVTPSILAIYYFFLQWATSAAIRLILLRVAKAVDAARADREVAEVGERVTRARRDYDREQLALLHDTVASTLMLVGQDTPIAPERLAAQAHRDLEVLRSRPWVSPARTELVAALRSACSHASTPLVFVGPKVLWIDGETASAVVAAAREAVTNVDRHAHATVARIDVQPGHVTISDNGVGFDGRPRPERHGLTESILGRMARIGGAADVTSAPGKGVSVELRWAAGPPEKQSSITDPDRLIERIRIGFGLALCAYAVANLLVTVPYSFQGDGHSEAHLLLGVLAAIATLTAISGIRFGRWWPAWPALAVLLAVTVGQSNLLDADALGSQAHWVQSGIGWCVLPLVLGMPVRRAAMIVSGYWLVGSLLIVLRNDSGAALVNIGLGTASILAVQLYALLFSDLMRGAASDARVETDAHLRLITRDQVAQAVQADYQRRYADLVDSVIPLLSTLMLGRPSSPDVRRRARSETQRLRTLFDQSRSFDNPLMREVRSIVDDFERQGVDVDVHVDGDLPELDSHAIERLLTPIALLISGPVTSTRLVLTAAAGAVTASVVCDLRAGEQMPDADMPDDCTVVAIDGKVWLTQTI